MWQLFGKGCKQSKLGWNMVELSRLATLGPGPSSLAGTATANAHLAISLLEALESCLLMSVL